MWVVAHVNMMEDELSLKPAGHATAEDAKQSVDEALEGSDGFGEWIWQQGNEQWVRSCTEEIYAVRNTHLTFS